MMSAMPENEWSAKPVAGRAEEWLSVLRHSIAEVVQRQARQMNHVNLQGVIRVTYTVTARGQMTNVRAEVIEEPSLRRSSQRLQLVRQQIEAAVASSLEGRRFALPEELGTGDAQLVGRQQTFASLTRQLH